MHMFKKGVTCIQAVTCIEQAWAPQEQDYAEPTTREDGRVGGPRRRGQLLSPLVFDPSGADRARAGAVRLAARRPIAREHAAAYRWAFEQEPLSEQIDPPWMMIITAL